MLKLYTLSAATLAGAAKLVGERDFSGYTYNHYLAEFDEKSFVAEREAIFESNLALIKEQNAKEDKTWHAGVNMFTDMTNDEFRKVYHGHKPVAVGTFPAADLTAIKGDLPETVDWKAQGKVTKTKNQGPCGSCWAFSVTETMESMYAIQNNDTPPILAPQQLVDCMANPDECGGTGGCEGSTQPLGFNYTMGAGLTLESNYPYKAKDGTCQTTTPVVQNGGMVELKRNDYTQLATAVANVGPIAISVAAGGFGWQIYRGGVYNSGHDFEMDHAVQLTGYGTDSKQMYWSVRNSWGPHWGEGGYIRLARFGEGNEPCGMDNNPADGDGCKDDPNTPIELCGMCGILSSSSYPTDVKKWASPN